MNRRCSYLNRDDKGTSLGYGTAVAQDSRYVTVTPDGGDGLLRVPVDHVDFGPLADPHRYTPAAQQAGRPQRTWISLDAPPLHHVRTEDHTTVSKPWIARLIDRLAWQPVTAGVDSAIQRAIERFHLTDVRQVATAPGLDEVGLRFDGIEVRCPHGQVRLFLFDHGTGPMVVCRDVWFDPPANRADDTATDQAR